MIIRLSDMRERRAARKAARLERGYVEGDKVRVYRHRWFAWRPVKTRRGDIAWLGWVWRDVVKRDWGYDISYRLLDH